MEKSKAKVEIANKDGATGSGTPYFAANGVLGASLLSGALKLQNVYVCMTR